jgi:hypothetical protein
MSLSVIPTLPRGIHFAITSPAILHCYCQEGMYDDG